jgi:DNA invertase Pin-like site-specific DNA recombinase
MIDSRTSHKIKPQHLARKAVVYLRQSSDRQVRHNVESKRLQYELKNQVKALGWNEVEVLDLDLGSSASLGAAIRPGFDQLVGAVALGQVGIVMSREVSRLSRTDKDWCHLLEVCRVFDTLVSDADQVYDLCLTDDQLVLGIKGTMSVVELNVLRQRLQAGREAKAARGELAVLLPPGYIWDASNKVVKDPDERVRQAIELVFTRFRDLWSIRQTYLGFVSEGIELPVNKFVGGRLRIVWQLPSQAFVGDVLHNPFYAGAYIYGRRPQETTFVDGRLRKRQSRKLPPEACRVFIPDHHEGYISWQTYEENLRLMSANRRPGKGDDTLQSIRAGQGLLAGLLRCGRCGRRLYVRYWGGRGTSARYLCEGDFELGGSRCIGFGGRAVDQRVGEQLMRALSPLGVRASIEAIERMDEGADERRHALALQLQQGEYEMQRAFEQYNEVDPRNRLVAAELERRWNEKLQQVDEMKVAFAEVDGQRRALTADQRQTLLTLGEHFEQVWLSERCPMEIRKKIARTAVEEIIVNLDEQTSTLHFIIHWKGGCHTAFEMDKLKPGAGHKTADADVEIICKMAVRYGDEETAAVLNRLGRRTGAGKRWNGQRVKTVRRGHSIPGRRRALHDPDIFSLGAAARHCGVSNTTIERLVDGGLLPKEQVVPFAPWEIRRADLKSAPVREVIEQLRQTGKLVLPGDASQDQLNLSL